VKVKDAKRALAGGTGNSLKMMQFGLNPGIPIPEIPVPISAALRISAGG